ncbi:hypothetical protein X801_03593, partial [Opisthorchis viverrini]
MAVQAAEDAQDVTDSISSTKPEIKVSPTEELNVDELLEKQTGIRILRLMKVIVDAVCKLDVLGHDGDPLGMSSTQNDTRGVKREELYSFFVHKLQQ